MVGVLLFNKFFVFHAMGTYALAFGAFVFLVLRVATLEEHNLTLVLERQNVSCHAIQEPTVVRDYHSTACKVVKTLLQRTQSVYVDVVGRLVEQQYVTFLFESSLQSLPEDSSRRQ